MIIKIDCEIFGDFWSCFGRGILFHLRSFKCQSESEILFSIIVPVYNVENYLETCINSMLLCRRDIRYEIILIDDGSTDGSGVICDQYAGKFEFIQVIHQRNQGLSVAGNRGIELSAGKYLLFVDSDDCLVNSISRD